MKRLAFWALLVISLSANLAMAAAAVWRRAPSGPGAPLLLSKLPLDPSQRARIAELRSRLMAVRCEHGRTLAELRQKLAATMLHQPESSAAIEQILRDIAEAQRAYQWEVVDHALGIRDLLRPDQRPVFDETVAGQMRSGGPMPYGCDVVP